MRAFLIALAAVSSAAFAQVAPRSDTGAAQPPNTIARSMCDALAGSERDRCLSEQKAAPDQGRGRDATPRRNCDDLLGPEKDACMKKGGRIKAVHPAPPGATRLTQ